ncbi:MAG: hypothetical protein QOH25_3558, partial [Acidobacteriota bacterium]|nr:hypothetical protein [Acidobacteriota bacterium]
MSDRLTGVASATVELIEEVDSTVA